MASGRITNGLVPSTPAIVSPNVHEPWPWIPGPTEVAKVHGNWALEVIVSQHGGVPPLLTAVP